MKYKQPEFYHFSQDSIDLAHYVSTKYTHCELLLDIGCGCGIIALELAKNLNNLRHIHFLEPQKEFIPYLKENIKLFLKPTLSYSIEMTSLSAYKTQNRFDLIVSNPPYFEKGKGRSSHDINKQICRTFELDNPKLFINSILSLLTDKGKAYILIPNEISSWKILIKEYRRHFRLEKKLNRASIYLLSKVNIDK